MSDRQNVANEAQGNSPGGGAPASDQSRRTHLLFLSLVLLVTFLTYFGTLWYQFVHDDEYQILGNAFIRSWRYLSQYFTGDVWAFRYPNFPGNYYRPLFLLWLRLNYVAFGLNPFGWHLTTVLAHVAATLLVYRLARRLLDDWVTALFAALIFGVHPIHIESTAWVSGVPEPLLAILLIPAYLCYLNARSGASRARSWFLGSLALYSLAMLMKETALVLPMLIFASEWLMFDRIRTRWYQSWPSKLAASLRRILPYLALTVPYLAARYHVLRGFENPNANPGILSIVLTWPSLLWLYIRNLLWPTRLAPYYDLDYVVHPTFGNVVIPGVAVALAVLGLWLWTRESGQAAMACLWLALPILPVLNVQVFGSGQFAHDRYLYLPSIGFAMLAAMGLRKLKVGKAQLLGQPALQTAAVLLLIFWLGINTTAQSACYTNHGTFYAYTYTGAPTTENFKTIQAGLLGEQGRFAEAAAIYRDILQQSPNSGLINFNLGYDYYLMGQQEEAERYLTRATQLTPGRPAAWFYLGLAEFKLNHLPEATRDLRRAVRISPHTDNYHFALGVVLKVQGDRGGALREFREEIAINPDHVAAQTQIREIESAAPPGQ